MGEWDSRVWKKEKKEKIMWQAGKIIFHQLSIMWRLMNRIRVKEREREKDGHQLMANG